MHELAITQSLVDACTAAAEGASVARVTVEIGCLSGVLPDAMRFCFDVCAQGTALAGAALDIVAVPASARCRECNRQARVHDCLWLCECGSANVEFSGGAELRIRHMEVY